MSRREGNNRLAVPAQDALVKQPIIIYLDTQDYINTFKKPADDPNVQTLREVLLRRDGGKVLIGYSAITLIEFITKPNIEYRAERRERGEHVKAICGRNAFPMIDDLQNGARFPNGGFWVGTPESKPIDLKSIWRKEEKKLIEGFVRQPGVNRNIRRRLKRPNAIFKLAKSANLEFMTQRDDYGSIPVPQSFIDDRVMTRLMCGEIRFEYAEKRLMEWANDPSEFSTIVYEYNDSDPVIDRFFKKTIDNMEGLAKEITILFGKILEHNKSIEAINEKIRRLKPLHSGRIKPLKQTRLAPSTGFSALEGKICSKYHPHFRTYLEEAISGNLVYKRSDMMDLYQMVYAYECDLFRCDRHMAHRFRNTPEVSTKLVAKFVDLPDRIDALLRQRP